MPPQPAWFHRLDDILDILDKMPEKYLDRRAVEKVFGVQERRARQIMAGLPGVVVGNAVAVDRVALKERLLEISQTGPFQWELSRRSRLEGAIEETRRHLRARRVQIPQSVSSQAAGLPDGVKVDRGILLIEFSSPEDLAGRLFALSQVMASDWDAFAKACSTSR